MSITAQQKEHGKKFDDFYMKVAEETAGLSYAERRKVGAVLVKDTNIISYGYNGTLPGDANACEYHDGTQLVTKPDVIHAEENALMKLVREGGVSSVGSTMYITAEPCMSCARMMANAGIRRVMYRDPYRVQDGQHLLIRRGIIVDNWKESENIGRTE